jgi:uncharacterized membrane protein YdjX (TVP38/TMEM64 family)
MLCILLAEGREKLFDHCAVSANTPILGQALFGVAAMLMCVAFAPVTVLACAGGFLFGVVPGAMTVSVAGTLGAGLAFLLGRTWLRPWAEARLTRSPRCRIVVEAVARQGFQVVFLTRLSPVIPSNFLNYLFGLTRMSLPRFLAASWLGMLPATFFYASLGQTAMSLAEDWTQSAADNLTFVCFGAAATLVTTLFVTRLARRSLRQALCSDLE